MDLADLVENNNYFRPLIILFWKQLIKNYPTEKVYINFIQKNCFYDFIKKKLNDNTYYIYIRNQHHLSFNLWQ